MVQVETAKGLVDREQLRVVDTVTDEENARRTVTEWYLGEECVRRDVWVSLLRGIASEVKGSLTGG